MNRLLRQFKVVAKHKKISTACRELGISQPALSKGIKTLENEYGLELFERLPRGMELTEAGKRLLIRINRMDMEYKYALDEMDEIKSGKSIKLRLGAGPIWEKKISQVMMQMYDDYPNLQLIIRSDTNEQLLPELIEGELDIVLGGGGNSQNSVLKQLSFVPLLEVKMKIAAHRRHPLAQSPNATIEQLAQYPWIAYQRSKGQFLDHLFERKGINPPKYTLQTEFMDAAMEMLRKRNALMCIAAQQLTDLPDNDIVEIELPEPIWNFHSGVWFQSAARQLPIVNRFIELLAESCKRA